MNNWYEELEGSGDVIISNRVRLARNMKNYSFASKMTTDEAERLISEIKNAFFSNQTVDGLYRYYDIDKLDSVEKVAMVERHVLSPLLINKIDKTALIMSTDENTSIMLNEEDHIRIQVIASGMQIDQTLEKANLIDDYLEEKIEYAFNEQFGYLTSCPTNVGTGMRASYMIHTPALASSGRLQIILEAMGKFGVLVRGIYGEGNTGEGSVFQISSQKTIGQSEQEIIDNLNGVVYQIAAQEKKLRQRLLKENKAQIEDTCYRAYGILTNARILSSKEAMGLLSDVKLGVDLQLIKLDGTFSVYDFSTSIQPANLQRITNRPLTAEERDIERARYIREKMPKRR